MFCVLRPLSISQFFPFRLCLSHLSGLQHHKLSVADLETFQVSAKKSVPPWRCSLIHHKGLSHHYALFCVSEEQNSKSTRIPVWESTIFGQINIDMLIKFKGAFSKKLKLSLNYYTRIYEISLFSVSEKKREKRSKKKRRTKQGVQLDDHNCHTFTCLCLNTYQHVYNNYLWRHYQ